MFAKAPGNDADSSFARSLQALEFELAGDFGAYDLKEEGASSFRTQLWTVSTLICFVQIVILIAELGVGGVVPMSQNPMVGPSPITMVLFGAKQGALIVYRKEGWRLIVPIFLHAGVIHLISNVLIQLFIGGYLNLVYGTPQFLFVYLASGIFGNLFSCIFLPDSVGVGSSGAVMGMLTSWVVWIVFRWNKIPILFRANRNIQLVVVVVSIVITIATSFAPFIDYGAHTGGVIQGFLLGLVVLSSELDNPYTKWAVRFAASATSISLFIWAIYYIAVVLQPNKVHLISCITAHCLQYSY